MLTNLTGFLIQWGITALALWVASLIFNGVRFASTASLIVSALLLLLVAKLVRGFTISGFWTAFFASLFISVFSLFLNSLAPDTEMTVYRLPPSGQTISM
jgi:putative membrane protein